MMVKRDIQTEADIRAVVDAFYGGITGDPVLVPFFEHLDLTTHLPKMVAFWSSVVFYTGTYHGQPLEKHAALEGLAAFHFDRWLQRFHQTIDARFEGEAAQRMKDRARQIGTVFQVKLGLVEVP